MSLATLKTKVKQLIEKAQNAGVESGAIDYPEWGFTRPNWWLPRPELTESTDKVWCLCEFSADMDSFDGIDLTSAQVVKNGKKQIWITKEAGNHAHMFWFGKGNASSWGSFSNYVIELLFNLKKQIGFSYCYQNTNWQNLKIVSGTTVAVGKYMSDGLRWSYDAKVFDCPLLLFNDSSFVQNSGLFKNTAIEKIPQFILNDNQPYTSGGNMFRNCCNLRSGRIDSWTALANTFNGCVNLEDVSFSADCSGFSTNTFASCSLLKNVSVDEGFSASLYIHHSTQFTSEVLHAIIENYADCTGMETAPTLQMGAANLEKVDGEHKAMLEAKNVNYL